MKTTKILPFRELLESTPDAMVIVHNEAGKIVLINSQTEKLFGYDREDLIGHSVERLIPARFQDRHLDHRAAYFSDPRVRALGVGPELYAIRKEGQEFPVEISLSPLETEEGTYVTAAIRDISERKRVEAGGGVERVATTRWRRNRAWPLRSRELSTPRIPPSVTQLTDGPEPPPLLLQGFVHFLLKGLHNGHNCSPNYHARFEPQPGAEDNERRRGCSTHPVRRPDRHERLYRVWLSQGGPN